MKSSGVLKNEHFYSFDFFPRKSWGGARAFRKKIIFENLQLTQILFKSLLNSLLVAFFLHIISHYYLIYSKKNVGLLPFLKVEGDHLPLKKLKFSQRVSPLCWKIRKVGSNKRFVFLLCSWLIMGRNSSEKEKKWRLKISVEMNNLRLCESGINSSQPTIEWV